MTAAERIAELEEENTQLRERLGVAVHHQRQARLQGRGLAPQTARLAALLYARDQRPVDFGVFDLAAPAKEVAREREIRILDTQVCFLRKRLPREAIINIRGVGYVLSPTGRAALAEWLGDAA